MTITTARVLERNASLPKIHSELFLQFYRFLLDHDSSERNATTYLRILFLFSGHIGPGKRICDVTSPDIKSFLDARIKLEDSDPEKRWIVTWNEYYNRLYGFFRWYCNRNSDVERESWSCPPQFSGLRRKRNRRDSRYTAGQVWTEDEIFTVVRYAGHAMVKAILAVMWDIVGRNHEVTKLRIKDLVFHENYAEAHVPWNTKTGHRPAALIASFPYLRDWLNVHPRAQDPEAHVFYSRTTGGQLTPDALWTMTSDLKKRMASLVAQGRVDTADTAALASVLKKPWNPYLVGRHSNITRMASKLNNNVQLAALAGWVKDSRRVRTYVHQSGHEIIDRVLVVSGIRKEEPVRVPQKPCPRCRHVNTLEASICSGCSTVLELAAWHNARESGQGPALQHYASEVASLRKEISEIRGLVGEALTAKGRYEEDDKKGKTDWA